MPRLTSLLRILRSFGLTARPAKPKPAKRPAGPAGWKGLEALESRVMPSVVTGVSSLSTHATIATGAGETPGTDAVRLLSQGPLPYGGGSPAGFGSSVDWVPSTDFTFSQLTTLRASYKSEVGTFGGGGPRFSIFFDWNNNGTLDDDEINGSNHM